jgi:hypothetical protein
MVFTTHTSESYQHGFHWHRSRVTAYKVTLTCKMADNAPAVANPVVFFDVALGGE